MNSKAGGQEAAENTGGPGDFAMAPKGRNKDSDTPQPSSQAGGKVAENPGTDENTAGGSDSAASPQAQKERQKDSDTGGHTGGAGRDCLGQDENTAGGSDSAMTPTGTYNSRTAQPHSHAGGGGDDCLGQDAAGNVPHTPVSSPGAAGNSTRETRAQAANRWTREGRREEADRRRLQLIRQGRLAGLSKRMAGEAAWLAVMAEFPPPGAEAVPQVESVPSEVIPASDPEAGRLVGLSDLPASWPPLPPNAPLQAEVQWVQAVRIDVVEALAGGGFRIRLERADSPAPSKAALSWLETAILFPAKFADVAVKTTAALEDDREAVRRERRSIEDVRSILAEMRAAKADNPR